MGKLLEFRSKNKKEINLDRDPELTKEEFEFYEDMIYMTEFADENDAVLAREGAFVFTEDLEVKLDYSNDFAKYIKARKNQNTKAHLYLVK